MHHAKCWGAALEPARLRLGAQRLSFKVSPAAVRDAKRPCVHVPNAAVWQLEIVGGRVVRSRAGTRVSSKCAGAVGAAAAAAWTAATPGAAVIGMLGVGTTGVVAGIGAWRRGWWRGRQKDSESNKSFCETDN